MADILPTKIAMATRHSRAVGRQKHTSKSVQLGLYNVAFVVASVYVMQNSDDHTSEEAQNTSSPEQLVLLRDLQTIQSVHDCSTDCKNHSSDKGAAHRLQLRAILIIGNEQGGASADCQRVHATTLPTSLQMEVSALNAILSKVEARTGASTV